MKNASTPPWHKTNPGVQATPEEWVEWFLSNDRAGQLEIAEWSIRFGEEANVCLMRHGGNR